MGYLQFVLYRGLLRGCGLQILNIFGQRVLHVLKRVAQLTYLIAMLDGRQQGVKLSLSHLVGGICQLFQGLYRTLNGEETYQECDKQHDNDDKQDDNAYHHTKHV